ncbi:hypothetical protein NHB18_21485, partial [Bacteroides fragilis]
FRTTGGFKASFPKHIKSYGRGERPTQANHQKQRFRYGYVTPPRPQRGSDQTAASLNGVLRRSDSEEILQGSENGCVLILKKVYGVALVGTGGPAPCRWALPDR